MAATSFPAPSSSSSYSHAVSRSMELLSCAKTALKIAQKDPTNNNLHVQSYSSAALTLSDTAQQQLANPVLEDGLSLLRTMEDQLSTLERLVKRRGHTNDPTAEITLLVESLQDEMQLFQNWLPTCLPRKNACTSQAYKHWQMVQDWFRQCVVQHNGRLQEILKIRSQVLKEQAQRQQRFTTTSSSTASKQQTQLNSPLFQLPSKKNVTIPVATAAASGTSSHSAPPTAAVAQTSMNTATAAATRTSTHSAPQSYPTSTNGTTAPSASNPYSRSNSNSNQSSSGGGYGGGNAYYGAYGGGAGSSTSSSGYGGAYGGNASYYGNNRAASGMGMRQRRPATALQQADNSQQQEQFMQQQQQYAQERQTQQRVQEARQAEQSLAQLGTLFGKMSTLVSQQSETVDKIEDDVEAANVDVQAGQDEIQILYALKKGNRALILKVFGLLIFFIIFMKVYQKNK